MRHYTHEKHSCATATLHTLPLKTVLNCLVFSRYHLDWPFRVKKTTNCYEVTSFSNLHSNCVYIVSFPRYGQILVKNRNFYIHPYLMPMAKVSALEFCWSDAVALLVRHQICDSQVEGSSPGWVLLWSGLGQVTYTCVPLSSSSIIWYQPRDSDALRLGT